MLAIPQKRRFLITMVVIIACATVVNFGLYYIIDLYHVEELKSIVTVASVIAIVIIIMIILIPRNKDDPPTTVLGETNSLTPPPEEDNLDDFVDEDLEKKD